MRHAEDIILVGGSAGAYDPILALLDVLPPVISQALCFVIHRNPRYETKIENSLAERLNRTVLSTMDKTPIEPNCIYFAPPGYHMMVEPDYTFSLDSSEPVCYARPSIDVLFQSAADVYGKHCTAILLSGANTDGGQGVRMVLEHGGRAFVQSPADAQISTMPRYALSINAQAQELSTASIVAYFSNLK